MKTNTGLNEKTRKILADNLSKLLADTYILELKTHSFHWNVTGPHFYSYHQLFEGQYTQLHDFTDELAERIRSLGFFAPGSYAEFSKLSSIKEAKRDLSATEMIKSLLADRELMGKHFSETIQLAGSHNDHDTADLLTQQLHEHEKAAWMLRSSL